MRTMGLQRPEPSFTEFACVSREFGPLEPARGPISPVGRALRRAGQNAEVGVPPVSWTPNRGNSIARKAGARPYGRLVFPPSWCEGRHPHGMRAALRVRGVWTLTAIMGVPAGHRFDAKRVVAVLLARHLGRFADPVADPGSVADHVGLAELASESGDRDLDCVGERVDVLVPCLLE